MIFIADRFELSLHSLFSQRNFLFCRFLEIDTDTFQVVDHFLVIIGVFFSLLLRVSPSLPASRAQYILILCNALGSPLDSKYIDVEPALLSMTDSHVIVCSAQVGVSFPPSLSLSLSVVLTKEKKIFFFKSLRPCICGRIERICPHRLSLVQNGVGVICYDG